MSIENELKNLLFDENCDGSLDNIVDYSKDEFGNVVAVSLDFNGDGVTDAKVYLEYDEKGRLVKKAMDKDSDGKIDSVATYQYDSEGNVTISYDDNADGKIDFVETTDEAGNTIITDIRGRKQKIMETINFIKDRYFK